MKAEPPYDSDCADLDEEAAMAMARRLIRENLAARESTLHLGYLKISRLPEEIASLTHLERLVLGNGSLDDQNGAMVWRNNMGMLFSRWVDDYPLVSLVGIETLQNLRGIDLAGCTRLEDLSPLGSLPNLELISARGCKSLITLDNT